MSDTPRTDKACGWPWGHHGRIETGDLRWSPDGPFVHSSVAREIERDNFALREALREIADASGFDNIGNWARNKAQAALKEAQP